MAVLTAATMVERTAAMTVATMVERTAVLLVVKTAAGMLAEIKKLKSVGMPGAEPAAKIRA